jgi:hypothetical protein
MPLMENFGPFGAVAAGAKSLAAGCSQSIRWTVSWA